MRKLLRELFPSSNPVRNAPGGPETGAPVACEGALVACEEERQIRQVLAAQGGSRERTAACLGISKATLWRKMKKYDIEL